MFQSDVFVDHVVDLWQRAKVILTRRTAWGEDSDAHVDRETWSSAWAIAGPQVQTWWWVRRWGTKHCGCVYNPITRRQVLICQTHWEAEHL